MVRLGFIPALMVAVAGPVAAAAGGDIAGPVEFWRIVEYSLGLLIAIAGYLVVRTLKQIDANQKETAAALISLTREFYTLKGEHSALSCKVQPNGSLKISQK
jgi:hypothetical protein